MTRSPNLLDNVYCDYPPSFILAARVVAESDTLVALFYWNFNPMAYPYSTYARRTCRAQGVRAWHDPAPDVSAFVMACGGHVGAGGCVRARLPPADFAHDSK